MDRRLFLKRVAQVTAGAAAATAILPALADGGIIENGAPYVVGETTGETILPASSANALNAELFGTYGAIPSATQTLHCSPKIFSKLLNLTGISETRKGWTSDIFDQCSVEYEEFQFRGMRVLKHNDFKEDYFVTRRQRLSIPPIRTGFE